MGLAHEPREPVYQKLKETIIREITNGTLAENDAILSERLLTEKFHISRISVRKAISDLIESNYLYTVPGKGTFVRGLNSKQGKDQPKTQNIAYLLWGDSDTLGVPYFARIVQGAEKECIKHDYHLLISTMETLWGDGDSLPSVIEQSKVDGVILEGVSLKTWRKISRIIPAVIISNYICEPDDTPDLNLLDYIAANSEGAVRKILEHLKKQGHRNVGFIYQSLSHSTFSERFHGFTNGVRGLQMKSKEKWIAGASSGAGAMKKIIDSGDLPSAIVACNDFFALDAMEACREAGISVPDQVSIVGFDDIEASPWSMPPLTTIRVLTSELGRMAARRLFEKIEDPSSPPTNIFVGTELIARESVKNLLQT